LFSDRRCRNLLEQIEVQLRPAALKYSLAREIKENLHKFLTKSEQNRPAKALLSLQGAFLWARGRCHLLFQTQKETLLNLNLFDLMDGKSQSALYCKYGKHILNLENMKPRVIVYRVKDVLLVSKCSPVFYTDGISSPTLGVFMETRRSRRLPVLQPQSPEGLREVYPFLDPSFFAQSPTTPTFMGVPKEPFSTPGQRNVERGSSGTSGEPVEEGRDGLSPSLMYDSECVRDFSAR
jgi:hypothetical protein